MQHELGADTLELVDIYPTADHLPLIPYYRESRRFRGVVTFTINDLRHPYTDTTRPLYRTAVAVGDYPVDQHHYAYPHRDLPDMNLFTVPSFGLPLGALLPENEDRLLLAEKSISVTNIVNGATRLHADRSGGRYGCCHGRKQSLFSALVVGKEYSGTVVERRYVSAALS